METLHHVTLTLQDVKGLWHFFFSFLNFSWGFTVSTSFDTCIFFFLVVYNKYSWYCLFSSFAVNTKVVHVFRISQF